MATIPTVVDNEIIATAWGNTVAGEVNNVCLKKTGGTMTGALLLQSPQSTNGAAAIRLDYADGRYVTASGTNPMTGDLQVGGNASSNQAGVQLRDEGSIVSRLNDPSSVSSVSVLIERGGASSAIGGHYLRFARTATSGGSALTSGSVSIVTGGATSFNEASDERLKDIVGPVDQPLERLNQLQPRHLAWKSDGTEFDGFLAHEVQAVVANAVVGERGAMTPEGEIDPQLLDTGKLVPLLVAAIQALAARVATLEGAG